MPLQSREPTFHRNADVVGLGINNPKNVDRGSPPRAKLKNFRPRQEKETGRLALSSFCLDNLDDNARWALLDTVSSNAPNPARAELKVSHIESIGLSADPDWHPERHVNIIDWPAEEDAQTSLTQSLYANQALCTRTV